MELNSIINKLSNQHKGTFVRIGWRSNIESAKARKEGIEVIKETDATVRWGIAYDHIARVKAQKAERIALGETLKEVKPWYKHMETHSYILQKLSDESKTYLQLYTINKKKSMKSRYFVNGVEMTKQQVMDSGYVNASEWAPKQECLIMNIPTENIRYVGKEV